MHPYDMLFYDQTSGNYTVRKWLDDLTERFGGIDSALVWPTYPHLGVDDRNQYDMIRLMPGGLNGVRKMIAELKAFNVNAIWPYNPWDDNGTRDEGLPAPQALARIIAQTGAYGFNGDTMAYIDPKFYLASVDAGRPAAMQAEEGGTFDSLPFTTLGWGESGWDALSPAPPRIGTFKWLQRKRMTTICRRWDKDRNDALLTAWFNGIGYTAWENVWGCFNGLTPRDAASLKRIAALLRFFGGRGYLASEDWEPHVPTEQVGVFASRFPKPSTTRLGRRAASSAVAVEEEDEEEEEGTIACAETLWALVERGGKNFTGVPILRLDDDTVRGCTFFDVYHGRELQPTMTTTARSTAASANNRNWSIALPLEARGIGAVLSAPKNAASSDAGLKRLLTTMAHLTSRQLASFSNIWAFAPQRRVPHLPPSKYWGPPSTAIDIPGASSYRYKVVGTEIEGDDPMVDVQYEWDASPHRRHDHTLAVKAFRIDRAPVSCAAYAEYLKDSKYAPSDDRNFLRWWPDWRRFRYPPGNGTTPVTSISLREAKTYCAWAGGRLPTGVEWQYAAQGGDPANIFPWGATDNTSLRPPVTAGRTTPAPYDSETFAKIGGASRFGMVDIVGNVWQYTADEFEDGHTHFVLLRGSSHYFIQNVSRWYFPSGDWRLDRHNRYNLMDDAYERAATLGFRCAYDAD